MADRFEGDEQGVIDGTLVRALIAEHERSRKPGLEKLWRYFRNPLEPVGAAGGGPAIRQAMEAGLPRRLTGRSSGIGGGERVGERREVVIENDIGWRVLTMVDFMFGKPVQITSTASDEATRFEIGRVLDAVWEASGGIGLLQDIALLGHVYGYVDLVVRVDEEALLAGGFGDAAAIAAEAIRIEPVEPTRGVPVVSASDYRRLDGYIVHFGRVLNEIENEPLAATRGSPSRGGRIGRLFGREVAKSLNGTARAQTRGSESRRTGTVTEVFGAGVWERFEDGARVERRESELLGDVVPVVHVQNMSQPFRYAGLSEVEALLALQDELNTRLSDRANRVTMQSFKMYLSKGLDGFDDAPVRPGTVWNTDNMEASIEAFGGDATSPSEERHIEELREAMDKISAVPPLAGGVVRAKLGNLSSANALRITLLSINVKTARKRVTYGRGIEQVSGLVLRALDAAGVLHTAPEERGLRIVWPDALGLEDDSSLDAAKTKLEIGVPEERVLSELGYTPTDPGIS